MSGSRMPPDRASPLATSLFPSPFGEVGILWAEQGGQVRVERVLLPRPGRPVAEWLGQAFPGLDRRSCAAIADVGQRIRRFLEGEQLTFDLGIAALERCSVFQRAVLLAEYAIPRGWVSTYGRIARALGVPGAARAVGRALAGNPFPILIPCHRAVRSGGTLGGYQGGAEMKRALLVLEGVVFCSPGQVSLERVYY